jgi:hypothetical protein
VCVTSSRFTQSDSSESSDSSITSFSVVLTNFFGRDFVVFDGLARFDVVSVFFLVVFFFVEVLVPFALFEESDTEAANFLFRFVDFVSIQPSLSVATVVTLDFRFLVTGLGFVSVTDLGRGSLIFALLDAINFLAVCVH